MPSALASLGGYSTIIIVSLLVISLFLQIVFRSNLTSQPPNGRHWQCRFCRSCSARSASQDPAQIWTGLLTHLPLHYLKFLSGWDKAFSRLVGIVRSAAWMDWTSWRPCASYGMVAAWTNFLRFENTGATGILPIAIGRESPTAPPPPHTLSASFLP